MHQYYWQTKDKVIVILLSVLIVICWGVILVRASQAHRYRQQAQQLQQATFVLQNQRAVRQKELNDRLARQAIDSPNPVIKQSAQQLQATKQAQRTAKALFQRLETFGSHREYVQSRQAAQAYLSGDALKSMKKSAKHGDDDGSGHSYINTSGLHYQFQDIQSSVGILQDNQVPVIMKVTYTQWFYDQQKHQQMDKGQTQTIVSGTYNVQTKKFTQLDYLDNLSQTNISN